MNNSNHGFEEDWVILKSFFPTNWEALAQETHALKGLRKDKTAESLLRTLLIHVGCGYSLRETVVRARRANLAQLSDVALLKRLRKSAHWLHQMCCSLFEERLVGMPSDQSPTMHMLDASIISEPGKTGSQWRLHYCLSWPSLTCDFFKLTPVEGKGNGESFSQFPVISGDYYLADRGYSKASGIRHVTENGAHLAVRLNPDSVRMLSANGQLFPLIKKLKAMAKPGCTAEWDVTIADSADRLAATGRLCVIRKTEDAIRLAQAKLKRRAQKNHMTLRPETLEYAKFVMVFTTFPRDSFPTAAVLDWYRLRWQIELVFKRFKQIAQLGHLPKYDPESSKAWLYGKLLVALLTEKIMAHAERFSPWGYDMERVTHSQHLA
jgi:Transposase DDE domain